MSEIIPRMRRRGFLASVVSFGLARAVGQSTASGDSPDTATFDPDGTAHITRTIPVPDTLSLEGRAYLAKNIAWAASAGTEEFKQHVETALRLYPVKVTENRIAGVPVKLVDPPTVPASRKDKVLLNFHGGGFTSDSGSLLETVPMASLTRTRAVAVLYSLSPAVKFPVAVDQALAVYRADLHNNGDSAAFFAVPSLRGVRPPSPNSMSSYVGDHPASDPLVSPLLGDVSHFPPTLCMT